LLEADVTLLPGSQPFTRRLIAFEDI